MINDDKNTDTIPRTSVQQLLETLALAARAENHLTFETVRVLLQSNSARRTQGSREAMWATTRDVLSELERTKLMTVGQLPRLRSQVDRLRESPCAITSRGREIASVYAEKQGQAFDRLLLIWLNEHPYYRLFMARVLKQPLYVPAVTGVKSLDLDKQQLQDVAVLSKAVVQHCVTRLGRLNVDDGELRLFQQEIQKRFAQMDASALRDPSLDAKQLVDKIQDSVVIPALLETERLPFDPVTFQHILKASGEFYSAAATSAHPDFVGRVVFATCDLRPDPSVVPDAPVEQVIHHGQASVAKRFRSSLEAAYRQLAVGGASYVSAFALRAMVCLQLNLQPQVFATCLGNLMAAGPSGDLAIYTELPFDPPPPGEDRIEINHNRIGRIKLSFKTGGV